MPHPDRLAQVLQRSEAARERQVGVGLLEPGPIVTAAGEAIPALGFNETSGRRDTMVDTLERPTTIGVAASEQRLKLLEDAGVLQAGLDAAQTVSAENSIEKMLAHQTAAAHSAAMGLVARLGTMEADGGAAPAVEIARTANAASRLMEVCVSAALALHRIKSGGTQRVLVQHQQLVVSGDAPQVVVNPLPNRRSRGGRGGSRRSKNAK